MRACVSGDEPGARRVVRRLVRVGLGSQIYGSSKIALNEWVRRAAVACTWAGEGIVVNAVAPGIIATEHVTRSRAQDREVLRVALPQPLGAPGPVGPVADLVAYAASPANRFMTGQVIYCDGNTNALVRRVRPQQVFLRYRPSEVVAMWKASRRGIVPGDDST